MMVSNEGSIWGLLAWQWKNTLIFTVASTIAFVIYEVLGYTWFKLPALPLGVVGGAIGIFVSFRTNSAYDRWWEGRKLWGRMINTSRHWGLQVMAYLPKAEGGAVSETQQRLIRRHIAYVHTLRCALRGQKPFDDEDFKQALPDDAEALQSESNLNTALLGRQLADVKALAQEAKIDSFELSNLDLSIRHLLDIQGGCERIKKTPMPRGYAFIAERLVRYFSFLFPLALVADLHAWVIPINLLVCMAFALISEAGRVLEDPFTLFWNGLPLMAISRMIEVNLEERMETPRDQLKPMLAPNEKGILM
ncbi:MAG: bestrophin family protein [Deltaproteobacteria bacterium]|jgi:putative membrane protein